MPQDDQPVTQRQLVEALNAQKAEILEALRETETKLLRGFFQYQEHADIKFRKLTADVSNVSASADLRIDNLEQRVVEIERRLLMGRGKQ